MTSVVDNDEQSVLYHKLPSFSTLLTFILFSMLCSTRVFFSMGLGPSCSLWCLRQYDESIGWVYLGNCCMLMTLDSLEGVVAKFRNWKNSMEAKGLRVNVGKTKVIISGEVQEAVAAGAKWPCAVQKKGVGRSLIMFVQMETGYTSSVAVSGEDCRMLLTLAWCVYVGVCVWGGVNHVAPAKMDILIIWNISLECVGEFCYLGDTINAGKVQKLTQLQG